MDQIEELEKLRKGELLLLPLKRPTKSAGESNPNVTTTVSVGKSWMLNSHSQASPAALGIVALSPSPSLVRVHGSWVISNGLESLYRLHCERRQVNVALNPTLLVVVELPEKKRRRPLLVGKINVVGSAPLLELIAALG